MQKNCLYRRHILVLALLLSASLLTGIFSANAAGDAQDGYPKTITDSAGLEITISMPVHRVIVLNTDAAEAVKVLGSSDLIWTGRGNKG